jgi:hypothetical protein
MAAPAWAGETVHIGERGLAVGETLQQTSKMAMQVDLEVVANDSLTVPQKLVFYELQERSLVCDKHDANGPTVVQLSVQRHESAQGAEALGPVERAPVVGHRYTLTRAADSIQVERQGGGGTPDELRIAGEAMVDAMQVGEAGALLPDTLEVGKATSLDTGAEATLFGGHLTAGTVTLERVEAGQGERRAHLLLALAIRTEPIPGLQGHMAVGGTMEVGVDSGRAYALKLQGEIKVSGGAIDGQQTMRLRGTGPVSVERTQRFASP